LPDFNPVTAPCVTPSTLTGTLSQTHSIFGCEVARSAMILRRAARRDDDQVDLAREPREKERFLGALSPPPMTATSICVKRAVHVAQVVTPLRRKAPFPRDAGHARAAPVAMMTVLARMVRSPAMSWRGMAVKSTGRPELLKARAEPGRLLAQVLHN